MDTTNKDLSEKAESLMRERFAKDSVIALATTENGIPHVRSVNAFYEDGAFYIITHGLSNKMQQIEKNPFVAVSGEWFTGHGHGINLGYFGNPENADIAQKLRQVFSEWIDNGHTDFNDRNTCILCIRLIDGLLLSHGKRYELNLNISARLCTDKNKNFAEGTE